MGARLNNRPVTMFLSPYDIALQRRAEENRPIRVGMLGAGNLARMLCLQLIGAPLAGIRLVAVANRTVGRAEALVREAGGTPRTVSVPADLARVSGNPGIGVTDDPHLVTDSDGVDVILDATGTVDFALGIVLRAFARGKHVVVANAELDSTLGPVLKARADAAGVVYTNIDGDEPGVAMNLVRYARSIGLRPVAAGNLKGMVDPYRTPETQRAFAAEHGQNPRIVTSFADGSKLAMELCILANATGFKVGRPGMYGPACKHVNDIAGLLPAHQMLDHGLVDYALGAAPGTGAFVVVHEESPARRRWLRYLKMGDGPFHVLYTPYHLPHIQAMATIARAVDCADATVAPVGPAVCQVIACAKHDLPAGSTLDGSGGFTCYGRIENVTPAPGATAGLPIALANACTLTRAIRRDERITVADIDRTTPSAAADLWLATLPATA